MTEWQAITWVLGGFVSALGLFITIKTLLEKHDEKVRLKATQEAKDEKDLDANWTKTRSLENMAIKTDNLATATNSLVTEMVVARNQNLPRELLKYDATKKLCEHHAKENVLFAEYVKKFEELEAEEREQKSVVKLDKGQK